MERLIEYQYRSYLEGCGCCSNSDSTYSVWEDGKLVVEDGWCPLMSSPEDLTDYFTVYNGDFEVHPDTNYF
jgi:hypothetical protein